MNLLCETELVGDALLTDLHSFYLSPINSSIKSRTLLTMALNTPEAHQRVYQ